MFRKIRLHIAQSLSEQNAVQLNIKQSHYLLSVMRCNHGDKIKIFNQEYGEWIGELTLVKKNLYIKPLKLLQILSIRPQSELVLCFAPTKKYGEFVVEKATELGVDCIMPILTERSIVNKINLEKYQTTAIEAAEQSNRLSLPIIFEMSAIKDIKAILTKHYINKKIIYVMCHIDCQTPLSIESLQMIMPQDDNFVLVMLIGPEGGFTDNDARFFDNILQIGDGIMRAETAAIVSMTIGCILIHKFK